ncbi:MAG: DUF3352 domain-containing protein [Acidobacteria bacterium]|nr:DUF3352 domain-containing protein [Acidobacteriota bacterium]
MPGIIRRQVFKAWMGLLVMLIQGVGVMPVLAQTPQPASQSTPVTESLARYLPDNQLLFIEIENLPGMVDELFKSEGIRKAVTKLSEGKITSPAQIEAKLQEMGFPDKATLSQLRFGFGFRVQTPDTSAPARRQANTALAMQVLRNLHSAQLVYQTSLGKGNFASSLKLLGPGGEEAAGFLDEPIVNMQTTPWNGYVLGPLKVTAAGNNVAPTYSITAFPAVKEGDAQTGDDCFYVSESGIIQHSGSATKSAGPESEPVESIPTAPSPSPEMVFLIKTPTVQVATQCITALIKLENYGRAGEPKTEEVGKNLVTVFPNTSLKLEDAFAYTIQPDGLVIISAFGQLKRFLTAPQDSPRLLNLKDFQVARQDLGQHWPALFYINTREAASLIEQSIQSETSKSSNKSQNETLARNLPRYLGFPSTGGFAFGFKVADGKFSQRFTVRLDHKGKGLFPVMVDTSVVNPKLADYAPANAQIVYGFGVNLLRLHDESLAISKELPDLPSMPKLDVLIGQIEQLCGIKLRDEVLAGLTGEYLMATSLGDFSKLGDPQAPPQETFTLVVAGVKDPVLLRKSAEKIALALAQLAPKDKPKPQVTENYQGVDLFHLGQGPTAITVALIENVAVAGKKEDVKRTIDARKEGLVLSKTAEFQRVMATVPPNTIYVNYMAEKPFRDLFKALQTAIPEDFKPLLNELIFDGSLMLQTVQRDDVRLYSDSGMSSGYLGIVAAIAIPNLLAARQSANRASAIQSLRNIHFAQVTYQESIGKGNFASSLAELGQADYLDNTILQMQEIPKSGYLLGPMKVTRGSKRVPATFSIYAVPVVKDGISKTGNDCFYIDHTGIIRHSGDPTQIPDAKSPPIE